MKEYFYPFWVQYITRKDTDEEKELSFVPIDSENSPLHTAVISNDLKNVEIIIQKPGTNINARNSNGKTPLFLACESEAVNVEIIFHLLIHEANPNIADRNGVTPILLACRNHDLIIVKQLIEYGADFNVRSRQNRTTLHYAIQNKSQDNTVFLLSLKVDTNVHDFRGDIPLCSAMLQGVQFAYLLVPHSNLRDEKLLSINLIEVCFQSNNFMTLKALFEHGFRFLFNEEYIKHTIFRSFLSNRFLIFKIIWNYIGNMWFVGNELVQIIKRFFVHGNRFNDFSYLNVVLQTKPKLNLDANMPFIFSIITSERPDHLQFENRRRQHFAQNKESYIIFITFFKEYSITLKSLDLQYFIEYFQDCDYKLELLKILFQNKSIIINSDVLWQTFINVNYNTKQILIALMGNCPYLDIDFVYSNIFYFKFSKVLDNFFLERFTPSAKMNKFRNTEIVTYRPRVKTLVEIARDAVRKKLRKNTNSPQEFLESLDQISVPEIVRDILKFKTPVN